VGEVADLSQVSSTLDKSQIGCYVSHNNRLVDVMVLSDLDYHIKVPISSKASSDDKILIMFKKLAGADNDEPICNIFELG
jgi:hypothetical protein